MSNYILAWPWLHNAFGKNFWMSPFYHRFTTDPLAVGATVEDTIRIQGDAFTMMLGWRHHAGVAPVNGVIGQTGEFTMTMAIEDRNVDEGALSNLIYGNTLVSNVLANSELHVPNDETFPYPLAIKPGGYLRFAITNGTLANNIIDLRWDIVKFYPKPGVSIESERQKVLRMG